MAAALGFTKSLQIQLRVVGALVLREMRVRFGRSQLGYLWAIAEPLAYIIAFSSMFYFFDRHPPYGNSMALFFATGILPFQLFRNLGNQLAAAFDSNQALLTYPIVQPIDTVIARAVLEVATALLIMLIVFGALFLAADTPLPNDIMRMLEALTLVSMLGFGIGLISAVVITHFRSWQNIFRMLMTPMLFLSGVIYSLDSLPPHFRDILAWNPLVHGIEAFRSGYYANYRSNDVDELYLLMWSLFATFIALAMERTLRGRIE